MAGLRNVTLIFLWSRRLRLLGSSVQKMQQQQQHRPRKNQKKTTKIWKGKMAAVCFACAYRVTHSVARRAWREWQKSKSVNKIQKYRCKYNDFFFFHRLNFFHLLRTSCCCFGCSRNNCAQLSHFFLLFKKKKEDRLWGIESSRENINIYFRSTSRLGERDFRVFYTTNGELCVCVL